MQRITLAIMRWVLPLVFGTRALFRQLTRPIMIGVRVLVLDGDRVLLVRHHGQGHWMLPGGRADRGESLRQTAIREVREETGCHVAADRLLGIYSSRHEGMTLHTAVFVCHPTSALPAHHSFEIAEARFWPVSALPDTRGYVELRLAEYQAGLRGIDTGLELRG